MKLPPIMLPNRFNWWSGLSLHSKGILNAHIWDDRRFTASALIGLYLTISMARVFLGFLYLGPGVMSDELLYKTSAQSFFMFGSFYKLSNSGVNTNIGNILYQYLISPSFYFGPNFYVAAKAINALIISTALFPSFLISRVFNDRRSSLLIAMIVLLFPFNLYANYMMPENLFFPLFMFSFYFIFKSLTRNRLVDAAASGVCVALLFLTKPHALMLILAMIVVVAILIVFARHFSIPKGQLVRSFMFTIMSMVTGCVIITLLLKHRLNTSEVLGFYSGTGWGLITNPVEFAEYSKDLLRMVIGHLTGLLFLFGIPLIVVLTALVRSFKAKDYQAFSFLLWGSTLFLVFFAMTIKFTIDIRDAEHMMRLHGRYYFFTYPFFLIAFMAFLRQVEPSMPSAAVFTVIGALVGTSLMTLFPTFFPPRWGMIVDLPEWAWLNTQNLKITSPVLAAAFLLLCLYYAFSKVRRPSPYILFLLVFLMIANIGEFFQQLGNSNNPWFAVKRPLALIESTIADRRDRLMVIGASADALLRFHLPFWLSYEAVYMKTLEPGSNVADDMIPADTKWLILLNQYQFTGAIGPSELTNRSGAVPSGSEPSTPQKPEIKTRTGPNTPPFGFIDSPVEGATVGGTAAVTGWAIDRESPSGSLTVTLLIDGNPVSAPLTRFSRPDVCAGYRKTAYPGACMSGVRLDWTTIGLIGNHTVAIRVTDENGLSTVLGPRTVKVRLLPIRSDGAISIYKLR